MDNKQRALPLDSHDEERIIYSTLMLSGWD